VTEWTFSREAFKNPFFKGDGPQYGTAVEKTSPLHYNKQNLDVHFFDLIRFDNFDKSY